MGDINITSKNQSGGITAQHVVANNENSPIIHSMNENKEVVIPQKKWKRILKIFFLIVGFIGSVITIWVFFKN